MAPRCGVNYHQGEPGECDGRPQSGGGGGRPLVVDSATVAVPLVGEPNSRRNMVRVRVPNAAKTSATAISPKWGMRRMWPLFSTPGKSVLISSTNEQIATPSVVADILSGFLSFASRFRKESKSLHSRSKS